MRTVDGLLADRVLRTAADALRDAGGDRAAAEAGLRRLGGTPYRGPFAQLSDELIPSYFHQAADVVALLPRQSNRERFPR